jgi:inosose dehydratase
MIQIANAPCSWGVIENVAGETGGYRRVLDEMAETGYAGTELGDWEFMPTDPDALRAELDSRGLALLASFATPWLQDPARHRQGEEDAVKIAKLLAAVGGPQTMIVLGNDPYGDPVRGKNAGSPRTWASATGGGRSTRMPPTGSPGGCATRPASGRLSTSTWAP